MNLNYSENQKLISETILNFSNREIIPNIMDWDEKQYFPVNVFKKLGELGMLGVLVPLKYGGSGFSYREYVTVVSEIGRVCGSIALSVAAHNSLCVGHMHTKASIEYYSSPMALNFGLATGCSINPKHEAFKYQKNFIKRPIISVASIQNSTPHIHFMPIENGPFKYSPFGPIILLGFEI